jgi:hypothetical protein
MRAIVVALVLFAATSATARAAHATTYASPVPTFSPAPGSALPADPTLFLFVPVWWLDDVAPQISVRDADTGATVPFTAGALTRSGRLAVQQLRLVARNQVIELRYNRFSAPLRYWVGASPRLERREVAIDDVRYVVDRSACSYTDGARIEGTGNAIAYRVEWFAGKHRAVTLPPSTRAMYDGWRDDDAPATPAETVRARAQLAASGRVELLLGHASCFGDLVDPAAFREQQEIRLVALFADGSSQLLGVGPIDAHRMGAPTSLIGASFRDAPPVVALAPPVVALAPPVACPAAAPPPAAEPALPLLLAALVAGALTAIGAVAGGAVVAWRQRRRLARHGTLGLRPPG